MFGNLHAICWFHKTEQHLQFIARVLFSSADSNFGVKCTSLSVEVMEDKPETAPADGELDSSTRSVAYISS